MPASKPWRVGPLTNVDYRAVPASHRCPIRQFFKYRTTSSNHAQKNSEKALSTESWKVMSQV